MGRQHLQLARIGELVGFEVRYHRYRSNSCAADSPTSRAWFGREERKLDVHFWRSNAIGLFRDRTRKQLLCDHRRYEGCCDRPQCPHYVGTLPV